MPGDGSVPPDGGDQHQNRRVRPALSGTTAITALIVVGLTAMVALSGRPVEATSRLVLPATVALALAVASIGAGSAAIALLRILLPHQKEGAETTLAAHLIVGYPLFGTLTFLVGLGSTSVFILLIPLAIFVVAGLRVVWNRRLLAGSTALNVGSLALGALLLTGLMMSLLPAVSLDEVSYHLAIPRLWIAEGSAVTLPLMSHSWFPLGTEAADLYSLALLGHQGAIASHLLHLFIAIGGAILVLRSLSRSTLASIGVAAILSTPAIILGAGWSGTDVPLVAVTFVLFLSLDRFLREGTGNEWVAASIAAGLLVKYTFLPVAAILTGAALLFARSRRRSLLAAAVAGAAMGSIFFVRNLLSTRNPIEPFLSGTGGDIARFRWAGTWSETLTAYMFDTRMIDDSLGFVLPALAIAALALMRAIEEPWRRAAGVGMLLMAIILSVIGPSARILLPFLFIPAWVALAALIGRRDRAVNIVTGTVLAFATVIQIGVAWLHIDRLDPLRALTAAVEDREWVANHRRTMPLIQQGNEILSESDRTLVLGVNELFWFDGRVTGGANFDSSRVSSYLSSSSERLIERLRDDGIERVLLYPGHIGVGSGAPVAIERQRALVLTPEAASSLSEALQRYGIVERRTADAVLYRLVP